MGHCIECSIHGLQMQAQNQNFLNKNAGLHRFAVFTACSTLILIIAGALVTGNEAGLAVPDWPLSYGSLNPPMIGGIFYEHGHRMIASFVGLMTLILGVWLWKREPRKAVRRLGIAAVGAVVAQGILGGITVLFFLPAPISILHACLAQAFFCMVASIAWVTSDHWRRGAFIVVEGQKDVPLRRLCLLTTVSVYLQLILGAALRHSKSGLLLHVAGALLVTFFILWIVARTHKYYQHSPSLFYPAVLLGVLLVSQLSLGVGSYIVRLMTREDVQPALFMVAVTTAHVAAGALLLVTSLILTLQVYKAAPPIVDALPLSPAPQRVTSRI